VAPTLAATDALDPELLPDEAPSVVVWKHPDPARATAREPKTTWARKNITPPERARRSKRGVGPRAGPCQKRLC
jgi:hypothetical protein